MNGHRRALVALLLIATAANAQSFRPNGGAGAGGSIAAGTTDDVTYYTAATTLGSNSKLSFPASGVMVNRTGAASVDFTVQGDTDASLIVADASADAVGFGTATPAAKVEVVGGTRSTAVFNTSMTIVNNTGLSAHFINVTPAANAGTPNQNGVFIRLGTGYTAGGQAVGVYGQTFGASTGTSSLGGTGGAFLANYAGFFQGIPGGGTSTVGHVVGAMGLAQLSSTRSIGMVGFGSGVLNANADTIGVYGTADIADGTQNRVGGMFTLLGLSDTLTVPASGAALIADNAAQSVPILLLRDSGTTQVSVANDGVAVFNVAGTATADFTASGDTVTALLFVDASVDNVGIRNAVPLSPLDVGAAAGFAIATIATDTTLSAAHYTVLCDATSATVTLTLPPAAGVTRRVYVVKKTDASVNTCVIDGNGAETIDGAATKTISLQNSSVEIQTNGTAWFITAGHAAATVY